MQLEFEATNLQELQAEIVKYIRIIRDAKTMNGHVSIGKKKKDFFDAQASALGSIAAQIESGKVKIS